MTRAKPIPTFHVNLEFSCDIMNDIKGYENKLYHAAEHLTHKDFHKITTNISEV